MDEINETALQARKLAVRLKRQMDKAEKTRKELCELLCGGALTFGAKMGLEDGVIAQIIAPKDDD